MDDAQKRAEQFNTEQRIVELEEEVEELRTALQRIADEDDLWCDHAEQAKRALGLP